MAAAAGCFTYDESSAVPDTLLHAQDACWRGDDGEFFKRVENSRWLVVLVTVMMLQLLLTCSNLRWISNIKNLLSSAAAVARSLHEGHAILVHCSHGWDRTPQVCALAEVMMDGHYRTMAGAAPPSPPPLI